MLLFFIWPDHLTHSSGIYKISYCAFLYYFACVRYHYKQQWHQHTPLAVPMMGPPLPQTLFLSLLFWMLSLFETPWSIFLAYILCSVSQNFLLYSVIYFTKVEEHGSHVDPLYLGIFFISHFLLKGIVYIPLAVSKCPREREGRHIFIVIMITKQITCTAYHHSGSSHGSRAPGQPRLWASRGELGFRVNLPTNSSSGRVSRQPLLYRSSFSLRVM